MPLWGTGEWEYWLCPTTEIKNCPCLEKETCCGFRQRELLQISCQHWFQHWFWSLNVIYSVLRCYISFVFINLWFWSNVSPFLWLLLVELVKSASLPSFFLNLGEWTGNKGTVCCFSYCQYCCHCLLAGTEQVPQCCACGDSAIANTWTILGLPSHFRSN